MTDPSPTPSDPVRAGLAKLRERFPDAAYGKLPKPLKRDAPKGHCKECGTYHGLPAIHLDYIGHASVTDRLLEVDPRWNWEPLAWTEDGLPRFLFSNGHPVGLWIRLTVLGITRLGFGSVEPGAFESEKQLIGDAMRNAAMRFGVALDLWSKAELESALLAGEDRRAPDNRTKPSADPKPLNPPRTLQDAAERAKPSAPPKPTPKPSAKAQEPEQQPEREPEREARPPRLEDVHPDALDEGWIQAWGLRVEPHIWDSWDRWKAGPCLAAATNATSKSGLKNHTWETAAQGSLAGRRMQSLVWSIRRGHDEQMEGRAPSTFDKRCARTLFALLSRAQAEEGERSTATTQIEAFSDATSADVWDPDPAQ